MEDRYKFRCYNKFQEKMFEVKSMSYIDDIVKRIDVQDEERILIFDEWQNNIDNTILMQCTGLKDKNGKLIYEGDIVKHSKSNQQYKVQWNDKGFWQLDDYAMARSSKFLEENYEVIGNIYENKELLESEEE